MSGDSGNEQRSDALRGADLDAVPDPMPEQRLCHRRGCRQPAPHRRDIVRRDDRERLIALRPLVGERHRATDVNLVLGSHLGGAHVYLPVQVSLLARWAPTVASFLDSERTPIPLPWF